MAPGDHTLPAAESFTHATTVASPAETAALGRAIARLLSGGEVVLLYGHLGAGKTSLVQGICAELAVDGEVVSPTFTLVNSYPGRVLVHHLDFYRIDPGHDLTDIGVPDLLDEIWDGRAVGLIEWPGPLVDELGTAPRFELLAVPGDLPTARIWHLRASPVVPPGWRQLFAPKASPSC